MDSKKFKKGLMFGILVGLAWGLDGVLMGRVGLDKIFSDKAFAMSQGISSLTFEYSPLVTAFFHEGFCFFWISLVLIFTKQFKHVFYLLFKTKKGKAVAIAALVGSPIGMSAYLLAIKYATTPYAASISVIYPGVGAILSYFVLKEKLSKRAGFGILVSLFGSFMLGFDPSGDVPKTFLIGVACAIVAVLGWALEGVIVGFAMKHIKDEDHIEATPQQFLCLRYFIATVAYAVIVLPAIGGYDLAGKIVSRGLVWQYAGIAVLGAITYLSWYKAVDLIGAAMGTALNSTAALWVIIFTAILPKIIPGFESNQIITPQIVLWGIVIVLGVFIFAIDPKMFRKKV